MILGIKKPAEIVSWFFYWTKLNSKVRKLIRVYLRKIDDEAI